MGLPGRPYTKWYRVWERTTIKDWYNEMVVVPLIFLVLLVHWWGTSANRRKAKAWASKHAPGLADEYASIGFGGTRAPGDSSGLLRAVWELWARRGVVE